MPKLPFLGRLYWKILPAVLILAALAFGIAIKFFDYELTDADIPGALVTSVIFSYLIHLWLLPAEYYDDEDEYDDEYYDEDDDYDEDDPDGTEAGPAP